MASDDALAAELDRLRRLDAVAALLPELFRALAVRDVFDRLSAISERVMTHDAMSISMPTEDGERLRIHVVPDSPGSSTVVSVDATARLEPRRADRTSSTRAPATAASSANRRRGGRGGLITADHLALTAAPSATSAPRDAIAAAVAPASLPTPPTGPTAPAFPAREDS